MAHTQFPVADAAADADQLYIGVGIRHVHLGLLITPRGDKTCRRKAVRLLPAMRHTGRDTHQILLRDAHLDGLLRKGIEERRHRSRTSGVGAQSVNMSVFFGMCHKCLADCLPVWNLIHEVRPPSSPLMLLRSDHTLPDSVHGDAMRPYSP